IGLRVSLLVNCSAPKIWDPLSHTVCREAHKPAFHFVARPPCRMRAGMFCPHSLSGGEAFRVGDRACAQARNHGDERGEYEGGFHHVPGSKASELQTVSPGAGAIACSRSAMKIDSRGNSQASFFAVMRIRFPKVNLLTGGWRLRF